MHRLPVRSERVRLHPRWQFLEASLLNNAAHALMFHYRLKMFLAILVRDISFSIDPSVEIEKKVK